MLRPADTPSLATLLVSSINDVPAVAKTVDFTPQYLQYLPDSIAQLTVRDSFLLAVTCLREVPRRAYSKA